MMTETAFPKEIKGSLIWFVCGCGYLAAGSKYDLGSAAEPGPGLYPLVIGLILTILAFGKLVLATKDHLRGGRAGIRRKGRLAPFACFADHQEQRFFITLGFFVLYLLLLVPFGFFATSFFFVIIMSRLAGADNWKQPLLLAVFLVVVSWVVFVYWLKIRLPEGWWL